MSLRTPSPTGRPGGDDDSLLRAMASMIAERGLHEVTSVDPRDLERDWAKWLRRYYGRYFSDSRGSPLPFAPHHQKHWDWVWSLRRGVRPAPLVEVWPRGSGKSTSAEIATVAVAARRVRRYGLYISMTQEQADGHVDTIASILESAEFGRSYPDVSSRMVGKYGRSRGWRRSRLRTASGFTVDAVGMDTAARGIKIDEARPDWIVIDDIDEPMDSPGITEKKIITITRTLLPTGAPDAAVLAIQNLVHKDGVFARLLDGRADYLSDREISGPHPAIKNLLYEEDGRGGWMITSGTPTWDGFGIREAQGMINLEGLSAFLIECQHAVRPPAGGLFSHLHYQHVRPEHVPPLVRVVCWVDPAVSNTDDSDSYGIQVDGLAPDGKIYRMWSWEQRSSPLDALTLAIRKAVEYQAESVGVETDQGGDTWELIYRQAGQQLGLPNRQVPHFKSAKAGSSVGPKSHRAQQMLADYERGRIIHVEDPFAPTVKTLEDALWRFPKTKPFDLVDASYWSWRDLRDYGDMDTATIYRLVSGAQVYS